MELKIINLDQIKEVTLDFDFKDTLYFSELYESIKHDGVLCPLLVIETGVDIYEIIDGRQRIAALRQLGQTEVYCVINDKIKKSNKNYHRCLLATQYLIKTPDHFKLAVYIKDNNLSFSDIHPSCILNKTNFANYQTLFEWKWSKYHTPQELENSFKATIRKKLF